MSMRRLSGQTCRALRAYAHRLEPRILFAQVAWDGEGSDGLWNTPLNWTTDRVPGANDDVRIDLTGTHTVTLAGPIASIASLSVGSAVAGSQRLVVKSGLSLSAPSVVNKTGVLELNAGGELDGSVQVTDGRLEWRGGTMSDGTVTVNNGTLSISGPDSKTLRRFKLDNLPDGTLDWSGGGDIVCSDGRISNRGTMTISGTGAIRSAGGANFLSTSGPLNQSGDTLIEVPFDSTGLITEAVTTVGGTLTLAGGGLSRAVFSVSGTLVFTGASYKIFGVGRIRGTGTVRFDGGTHDLLTSDVIAAARLEVRNSGTEVEVYEFNVTDLVVSDGATFRATRGIGHATTLSVDPLSRLDLSGDGFILDYPAGAPTPLPRVRELLTSGYAGGAWNGSGISSSAAANTAGEALGYAEAGQLFSSFPAMFLRRSVDQTSILIRPTRYGDANLDGEMNTADFARMARNYGATGKDWSDGDFTYDRAVTVADFNLVAAQFAPAPPPVLDHGVLRIKGTDVPGTIGLTRRGALMRVRVNGKLSTFPAASIARADIRSGAESDVVDWSGIDVPAWIDTGDGNDTVTGGAADDRVYSGAGDDMIFGGQGDDLIEAGADADTVWGERGRDSLRGGAGDDVINAGAGNDHLWGYEGNDRLYGRAGNDAIDGGTGFDRLFGDTGNDRLFARDAEADRLDGGDGNDAAQADDVVDGLLEIEDLLG